MRRGIAAANRRRRRQSVAFVTPPAGTYPVSVENASWSATAKTVYDLSSAANTGYRSAPTKTVGVDALPAGATANSSTHILTLAGTGGTFSGWNVGNYEVDVNAAGWTLEDNLFNGGPNVTVYTVRIAASNTVIRYNTFEGNYGQNLQVAIGCTTGAWVGIQIYRNRLLNVGDDQMKINTTTTSLADRPQIYENYITIGGWGDPAAHFDAVSLSLGAGNIYSNHFNLTTYLDPANASNPPIPRNTPPAGAPAGTYSYGLTNACRFSDLTAGGTLTNITVKNNIIYGHKRNPGGAISQIVNNANATEGTFEYIDNIMEECFNNSLIYPTLPTDPGFSFTFTGNTRWSDGAAYTTYTGGTAVAPSAPVLDSADSVTSTSFRVIFDRGGNSGSSGNHQYALSTDGGSTWGAWTTLATTHLISGLTTGTSYKVKLRASNANGIGPESNVLTQATL